MIRRKKIFSVFTFLFLLTLVFGVEQPAHSKKKKPKENNAPRANNSLAVENYQKGREAYLVFTPKGFQDAIEYYSRAIQADPRFAPAYAGLGEVYSFMGYYKLEAREDYEEYYNNSYKNMIKALELDGNGKECQRALALSYLHLRRLKEAETAAKRVLEQDPNDAESYYIIWAATGQDPESPYIKKALELNPNLVVAHIGLAKAYFFKKGNYRKATEHYKKAVELADSPQLHNYLGTSLRTEGYLGQAMSEYQKAIELDPNYAPAYMNLGITLFYLDRFEESIAKQKKAISLNPNYPDAYYYLARAYEKTNNPQEAIKNYKTFISLVSNQENYSDYIASARESLVKLAGNKQQW
jgi:tetratricopeptide (TPR) repeat protein